MMEYWTNAWNITLELAVWLLLGLLIAGLLHILLPPDFIRRHLGGQGKASVWKAVLIGVPLPLCSCGVIPAAASLKKEGAGNGASIGFLISTPQTGVDSIAVSASFLGLPFALFKVFSALLMGLLGGYLTNKIKVADQEISTTDSSCQLKSSQPLTISEKISELIRYAVGDIYRSLWKWLMIGILLSALITTFVPAGSLADKPWAGGWMGMLIMLLISLPLYVCATGSVPIAASLVASGMSPGSALVFLIAGPASNMATIGAVWKMFGGKILSIYLGVLIFGSMGLGWLFDGLLSIEISHEHHHGHHMEHTNLIHWISALLLMIMTVWYLLQDLTGWVKPIIRQKSGGTMGGEIIVLQVNGMTCPNCVAHVKRALSAIQGITNLDISLADNKATISGHSLDRKQLIKAIEDAGYQAK